VLRRAGFSWWEAWGPVAYLGFQKGGQSLPSSSSFPFPLRGLVGGPMLMGGLGPGAPVPLNPALVLREAFDEIFNACF